MLSTILTGYLAIAAIVAGVWLVLFLLDETTPKTHLLSWLVILIAPLFWPIVLPISALELLGKGLNRGSKTSSVSKRKNQRVSPANSEASSINLPQES